MATLPQHSYSVLQAETRETIRDAVRRAYETELESCKRQSKSTIMALKGTIDVLKTQLEVELLMTRNRQACGIRIVLHRPNARPTQRTCAPTMRLCWRRTLVCESRRCCSLKSSMPHDWFSTVIFTTPDQLVCSRNHRQQKLSYKRA